MLWARISLARACLSVDQDVAVLGSHLPDGFFQFQDGRVGADEVVQGMELFLPDGAIGQDLVLGPALQLFNQLFSLFQPEYIFLEIDGGGQGSIFKDRVGCIERIVFLAVHGLVTAQPVADFLLFPDAGQGGAFLRCDVVDLQQFAALIKGGSRESHGLPGFLVHVYGSALRGIDVDADFQQVQSLFQQFLIRCHSALLLCA